jgi:predicted GH43/DUF377 family glycosyl hydrolase
MIIQRSKNNPILKPDRNQSWEAEAVFNGCPVKVGSRIYLLYRALSLPHYHTSAQTKMMISDIGLAVSQDGVHFENRRRFIVPEHSWERFGCEDPRATKLGDKYYIFYTAISAYPFRPEGIKVGLAISRDLNTIEEKHLVTPFNAKGMALFPEKIGGKIYAILTLHTDRPPSKICLADFEKEQDIWSQDYWQKWYGNFEKYALPLQRKPEDHIEVGAPPVKTKYGWLIIYSYIRNYFSDRRSFTIEAALLDLNNPLKVIARTESPILAPEEYYERIGLVPNVVFPSGAIVRGDNLYLYYGAADTTCCLAFVKLSSLLGQMLEKNKRTVKLIRAKENPIIVPDKNQPWENKAVFNPAALHLENRVHLLYRAMSEDNTSVLGYAASQDGIRIDYRSEKPAYVPREPFEQKLSPGGNSGCEDPRLTRIGDKVYMCYTAFDGKNPPRVALTWIAVKDFLAEQWNWAKPVLISPPDMDDKDAFLFPEKINGKYMIVHRGGDDIDFAFVQTLDFKENQWIEEHRWIGPRKWWWDSKKVGAAAPPIKTEQGWVMLYHGVSESGTYRVGAVLLDLKNPVKIIGRTDNPIFEPEAPYEKEGQIQNVVFPCGNVLFKDKLFVYYGGADKVVGVATVELSELLRVLKL